MSAFVLPAPFAPLSPSAAETFQLCPHKAMLSHFLLESEFSEALHKGQAVHAMARDACELFRRSGLWPELDELLPILRGHLGHLPPGESLAKLEERVDGWLAELLSCADGFARFARKHIPAGSMVSAEEWVRLDVLDPGGTVRVTGRLDLLLRVHGELWVLDLKTGKPSEAPEVSGPLAMALYVAAVREAHPQATVRGYELYLSTGTLVEYDADNLPRDLKKLVTLGHRHFVETRWERHTGVHCNWCEHHHKCFGEDGQF